MKSGDSIKISLPGNVFFVAEYRRTDMWGNIEGYFVGHMGAFINTQLQAVAIYYLRTEHGISFSVDQGRVTELQSSKEINHVEKCECGTEAVGGSRHQYYCPKFSEMRNLS
jgi:hypothetical protein